MSEINLKRYKFDLVHSFLQSLTLISHFALGVFVDLDTDRLTESKYLAIINLYDN